ncbi:MAG: hypothetical protein WDN66_02345 [Candidatus Saccharibacteria bacterium]
MPLINKVVLVSGAESFTDKDAINVLMDPSVPVNSEKAVEEHELLIDTFKSVGIKVVKVDPPHGCQDGIYVANWALVKDHVAVLSRLPNKRKPEEAYAKRVLNDLGFKTIELPQEIKAFSGQGDSIYCEGVLFCQSPYRTSVGAHEYLKKYLGYDTVLSLKTKPAREHWYSKPVINSLTGWPDSPTYDIDLAIAAIRPATENNLPVIAYCPSVFEHSSRKILKKLKGFDKITVSKEECLSAYALNLVSTGEAAIINSGAPHLKAELIKRGLKVIELDLPELRKGGGSIRCCSLTLA